jgi:hypothetical protein
VPPFESRHGPIGVPPHAPGGPPGNERLTSSTGLVLLVLLAVETSTTLALRTYLPVHIFLGLLLLPPVALELAGTGWPFLRYYTRNKPYRLEGEPRPLLRMLAPLLVASTLSLFGSGIALIAFGHGGGVLLTVHTLSFIAWGVSMIVLAEPPLQSPTSRRSRAPAGAQRFGSVERYR